MSYYIINHEILSQIRLIETKDAIVPIDLNGKMCLCKTITQNYPHLSDILKQCEIVETLPE